MAVYEKVKLVMIDVSGWFQDWELFKTYSELSSACSMITLDGTEMS